MSSSFSKSSQRVSAITVGEFSSSFRKLIVSGWFSSVGFPFVAGNSSALYAGKATARTLSLPLVPWLALWLISTVQ